MSVTESAKSIQDIEATVRRLAAEQVGIAPQAVTLQSAFELDLGFDSLDKVEFVMTLEETYELDIPDEQAEKAVTVGDAVALVRATRGA
ncbi:MAG: acyl carrier protein [Phycisphaerae bacterium]